MLKFKIGQSEYRVTRVFSRTVWGVKLVDDNNLQISQKVIKGVPIESVITCDRSDCPSCMMHKKNMGLVSPLVKSL